MDTITHSATPNPYQPRAERIAARVLAAIERTRQQYHEPMDRLTNAVYVWLASAHIEVFRAAHAILEDAVNGAAARLIANERAVITPMEEAGKALHRFVDQHAEEVMEDLAQMYADLGPYTLDQVDWTRLAAVKIGAASGPSMAILRDRIIHNALVIFAALDGIAAPDRLSEYGER